MDAKYWSGDDDRDTLDPDYDEPRCESCGVTPDQPCEPECGCAHCRRRDLDAKDAAEARPTRGAA